VEINTVKIELEERVCACGCKKVFRSLPSSQARYSSHFCMEVAGVIPAALKTGFKAGGKDGESKEGAAPALTGKKASVEPAA
jgi:hypothetical protein